MAKKNEPITTWESEWHWDWYWFAIGGLCDFKGKFYMIHLGFFHFMRCRVTKYVVEKTKRKKK